MTYEELARGIEIIIPADGLKEKLATAEKEHRPLIIKFGMDPTAPDLHLGHAVALKKIRAFLNAGHEIHLIVGNFTALIGDPSGRNTMRPPLTPEEVRHNAETYVAQLSKVLDTSRIHIHYNNDWLGKLSFADILKLLSKATLSQIMQREDFKNRYENNIPIALHELIYPLIQGYDSVAINADIEFGGRDQLLNCLFGKALQETLGKPGQVVLTMPLLCGLDGHIKMSKSKGNYIGLTEHPNDMYGKTMSIPDSLIPEWTELTTSWTPEEKSNVIAAYKNQTENPMTLKKRIAFNIVEQYHGVSAAREAEAFFYKQVQQKGFENKTFQEVSFEEIAPSGQIILSDLGAHLLGQSKSAIRRLAESGAICLNGEKVNDAFLTITREQLPVQLKIGKRGFFTLK